MHRTDNPRRTILVCVCLGAITLAAFWPVLHNGFVNYDDPVYVTENPHVLAGLSWASAGWALRTDQAGNWNPLTWLSHSLDVEWFGLNPAGHHLTSLLLHAGNVVLLFLLLKGLTGTLWRSAFVAALFALHPLHVESVAWVAERKDVLSAFFFMLTLLAYVRYAEGRRGKAESRKQKAENGSGGVEVQSPASKVQGRWSVISNQTSRARAAATALRTMGSRSLITDHRSLFYLLSLAFFTLGLMSKPMLVTLPFVLLLLDYWPLGRFQLPRLWTLDFRLWTSSPPRSTTSLLRLLWEKVPFLALSLVSCVVTFLAQRHVGAVHSLEALPLGFRVSNAIISYVRYGAKMFWPARLSVFYPAPAAWPIEWVLGAALLLAALTAWSLWRLRRAPYLAVGWFWYLGTLVPVIGLIQVGNQAMADRYSYIPLIGLFIMLVWGVSEACQAWQFRRPKPEDRNPKEGRRPISEEDACPSRSAVVSGAEAGSFGLRGSGFSRSSGFDLRPSFGLRPSGFGFPQAALAGLAGAVLLACVVLTWGQLAYWRNTATLFEHALAVTSRNVVAHNDLGACLLAAGNVTAAESHFAEAVRLRPGYQDAVMNLGLCYERQGRTNDAFEMVQRAARLRPSPGAEYSLARLLSQQGKLEEAESHFRSALKLKPEFAEAWCELGVLHAKQGRAEAAAEDYAAALRVQPTYAQAHLALGALLGGQKKFEEAIAHFNAVLRADPDNADAQFNIGAALSAQGDFAGAATHYAAAARLRPDDIETRQNLGLVLLSQGKLSEAAVQFQAMLRVRPSASAHYYLALALDGLGQAAEAAAQYREAIRREPKAPLYLNDLAWLLATTPRDETRNGDEAVRLAAEACRLSGGRIARFWGTLDAAYAEAGRFEEAAATAAKTRELALAAGQPDIAKAAAERLALYRARQPFRSRALPVTPP